MRIAPESDWPALVALQRASYALEAELIGSTAIPALHETAADIERSGETILGARGADGGLIGAVGYVEHADRTEICRLVVDPGQLRRGIATRLLDAVPGSRQSVATAAANVPAVALYERRGFRVERRWTTRDGLELVGLALG